MTERQTFTIRLEQQQDYQFNVKFDWPAVADLLVDEPEPLGESNGPNASRLVAAAVANCLTASLLFCMRKFKQTPGALRTDVTTTLGRNERGRLRIAKIDTVIHLSDSTEAIAHFDRCIQQFEDFCVVTDSIRNGIPVSVQVLDADGKEAFNSESP